MVDRFVFDRYSGSEAPTYVPDSGVPDVSLTDIFPRKLLRETLPLPDPGERETVRHFSALAANNFSVDGNFYPLGSCTMKHNPRLHEQAAALEGLRDLHPYQPEDSVQGALGLLYELERCLCAITGMDYFSLIPSSGAHGEFTGMMMIRKYHEQRGVKKTHVLVPDSAHGTNPASAAMCGYATVVVPSNSGGCVDARAFSRALNEQTAAVMLTNPNTLGIFEEEISELKRMAHEKGALLYYDGANFNALAGIGAPRAMGFDVMHLNLHKTFSTPHGCGGPGAGVVGVTERLRAYLPVPRIERRDGRYSWSQGSPETIGTIRSFYGNFLVCVRAYAYVLRLGGAGLRRMSEHAVLNANYVQRMLKEVLDVPYDRACMHEAVFSCASLAGRGVRAYDVAKRLIDYGIHPPTMYFPLIVKEALMVEPTETESKETLDRFIEAVRAICREAREEPDRLLRAPLSRPGGRVDEARAARALEVKWNPAAGR
ncbi:MAG: aminotransferase class V-fold PLP-dependent enzyme [Candidatus Omnitrophica bacterium]|nr:aminotransferase class V-fold PLP-dependent enzyme [Candidatus Omnitrophota bacterium]